MNVKGFIIEDDQGREFVMMCTQATLQTGKTFVLRGWQRRRLVPLQYSEPELRRIVAGVLTTLNDLFRSLPKALGNLHGISSDGKRSTALLVGRTSGLNKISRKERETAKPK